jgi:hypothetical protein
VYITDKKEIGNNVVYTLKVLYTDGVWKTFINATKDIVLKFFTTLETQKNKCSTQVRHKFNDASAPVYITSQYHRDSGQYLPENYDVRLTNKTIYDFDKSHRNGGHYES